MAAYVGSPSNGGRGRGAAFCGSGQFLMQGRWHLWTDSAASLLPSAEAWPGSSECASRKANPAHVLRPPAAPARARRRQRLCKRRGRCRLLCCLGSRKQRHLQPLRTQGCQGLTRPRGALMAHEQGAHAAAAVMGSLVQDTQAKESIPWPQHLDTLEPVPVSHLLLSAIQPRRLLAMPSASDSGIDVLTAAGRY
jgi:hypothetical protein